MAARGQTKTGGRRKGTTNKATADIKALAQKHGHAAIKELANLLKSDDERTRVAAIKELLDRGYGKARQPVGGDDDGAPITHIHHVIVDPQDPGR